jgi:heme/copper-type cytochrome/quinol oxidase subunit 2
VAASMVNVMQQVGGALGLAILVTIYGTASRAAARHPVLGASAAAQAEHIKVHGMAAAFTAAAIFDAVALIVITIAIRMRQAGAPAGQQQSGETERLTTEVLDAELLEAEAM